MKFLDIYDNVVRVFLVASSIYYVCKHNIKTAISSLIVFVLTFLPMLLEFASDIKIDLSGRILYTAIVFAAIYLGTSHKFYDRYRWWDRLIHLAAGVMFVSFGLAFTNLLDLSRFKQLFFCLTFAVFAHTVWEIVEYIADSIMFANNQRWQNTPGNHQPAWAIQPAGLVDTMNDAIFCIAGALAACAVWWFLL